MKLFKRTSITLLIFIFLVWIFMFACVYYPMNNVTVTAVEKEQTKMLLQNSNISAPKNLLNVNSHSIKGADVIYLADNKEDYAESVLGVRVINNDTNNFSLNGVKLTFNNKSVTISGTEKSLTDISESNAIGKTKVILNNFHVQKSNMTAYVTKDTDEFIVTFIPEYRRKLVYDAKIKISIKQSGEYVMEFTPIKLVKNNMKLLPKTPCSALAELTLSNTVNGLKIHKMTLGYKISDNILVPVWEIDTDSNKYYVD